MKRFRQIFLHSITYPISPQPIYNHPLILSQGILNPPSLPTFFSPSADSTKNRAPREKSKGIVTVGDIRSSWDISHPSFCCREDNERTFRHFLRHPSNCLQSSFSYPLADGRQLFFSLF